MTRSRLPLVAFLHRITGTLMGTVIGAGVVLYFAYYAIQGDRGLMALRRLEAETLAVQQKLESLRAERLRLEQRASLLHPEALDPDMLEERARHLLNFSLPNDILLMLNPQENPDDPSQNPNR